MNTLKRAMGYQSRPVMVPSTPSSMSLPYMGVTVPTVGVTEWDYDKYFKDEINIIHPEDTKYADYRRGVHDLSMYNYLFGIARTGFDLMTCNVVRTNPFFVMNEAIVTDYLRQVKFDVVDRKGNRKDQMYEFFAYPNPQQSFWDVWIPAVRDMFAYDAGVVTITYGPDGRVAELKPYRGTEFWAELDRVAFKGNNMPFNPATSSYISHGYVVRWWQHTANGLFIPWNPEEVVYLMRYPQSGSVYGTDIMKYFRFHYRGLMSATVAYGKIMDNGLNSGVVFKHPDIGSIDILQERINGLRKVNGGPTNYGKPLHLIGQEEVHTISNNNLMNQQFIEGIKFNAYLISNLFGLPSAEFTLESAGSSRTASYNQKDIRKSRGIGSILSIIEKAINRQILPRMKGYVKGDHFFFEEYTDLDDKLKQAYVVSQNMMSFAQAQQMGIPMDIGLKLTSFGKELTSEERDRISDIINEHSDEWDNDVARRGRYEGDDYQETFMGYKDISMNENEKTFLVHPESKR